MSSARWGFKYLDYIEGLAGGANIAGGRPAAGGAYGHPPGRPLNGSPAGAAEKGAAGGSGAGMSAAGMKAGGRAAAAAGEAAAGYTAAASAAAKRVKEADIRAGDPADTRENTAAAGPDGAGSGKIGPDKKNPRTGVQSLAGEAFKLDFSDRSLLNGIILAEILGRPKCFKKGRW